MERVTAEDHPTPQASNLALAATALGGSRVEPTTESGSALGDPAVGVERIGRFRVLETLGHGGMGIVYLAHDDQLDRGVAIKLVRTDARGARGRARVLREAKAMARLSHPNVAQVYEVGEFRGQVFVAMEFVRGSTLAVWLAASTRSWREIVGVFQQAGRGLEAAHRKGIIHRDFKPTNVMVGEDRRVRVLDFGIARARAEVDDDPPREGLLADPDAVLDHTLTATGVLMGTPAYMSPEQFSAERLDARADQFSFCVALYEALFGARPFSGATVGALAFQTRMGDITEPTLGVVPRELWSALRRGLDPDREARWGSMGALLEAVERTLAPRRSSTAYLWPALALLSSALAIAAVLSRGDPTAPEVAERETAIALAPPPSLPPERPAEEPAPEGSEVDVLRERAREYGLVNKHWVFPPEGEPSATALRQVLALESVWGDGAQDGREAARALRREFTGVLSSLGDELFESEATRGRARRYYSQACLFEPGNVVACERSGLTEQEREELTERVVKGSFSPEDLAIQEELERDSARPSVEGPPPPKPVVVAEVKPSRRAVKRVSPEPIEGEMPARPSKAAINQGISSIAHKIMACKSKGWFPGQTIKVKITVSSEGDVERATALGPIAGTPLARCIEGGVRSAYFGRSEKGTQFLHEFRG